MRRLIFLAILLTVAGPLATRPAAGQSKVGTTVAQFLGIEPSARNAGMGNAGVALPEGIEAVYFNVGAIGTIDRPTVQLTHSEWFAGIDFDYAAGALPIGRWGTLFASLTALNSGDILVRTVTQPEGTGERYTVGDVALGLGYGRRITRRFSAGIRANWVHQRIWHTTLNAGTIDLGTVYRFRENGLTIGSSLSNVGTRSRFTGRDLAIQYDADADTFGGNSTLPAEQFTNQYPMPLLFRVGISYPLRIRGDAEMLFLLDALHPNDNSESIDVGLECSLRRRLCLRAGYQNLFQDESEVGWTLGVGLRGGVAERSFQVDYGWGSHDHLDETHRLTLVLEL
jgi:hypothetical protein